MSLTPELLAAYKNLKRAKLALKHAEETLYAELPEDVAGEIHYNGQHAQVSAEYTDIKRELIHE